MDVISDAKYGVMWEDKSLEIVRPQEVVEELDLILKKQRLQQF